VTARLISVIGPPAVGKTTAAEGLAAALPAEVIREDYANNPFLADSFLGRCEARLPSQLYFLVSRVGQLSGTGWAEAGVYVSDYGFCQDRIYARARLDDGDYRLYDGVARRLAPLVRRCDLVVALDAGIDTLLGRIAARGRHFEKAMTAEFLSSMRESYAAAVRAMDCPMISVDCDAADLRLDSAIEELVTEIRKRIPRIARTARVD